MADHPDYRVPDASEPEAKRLGWIREAIQEGRSFVSSTRAAQDYDEAVDIISGVSQEKIPKGRSQLQYNRLKRQIREVVASSSTLRAIPAFSTDNRDLEEQNFILNKLWRAWWGTTFAARGIRAAKQWAAVSGTGWLSPLWDQDFYVLGRGDIRLHAYGAMDVLPIQMARDGDIQKAYAVIVSTEVPLAYAHALYPEYADQIVADRTKPGFFRRVYQKAQRFASPALNAAARDKKSDQPFPQCDLYNIYILDSSVNMTDHKIPMGDPGTSWYYEVPPYRSDILVGERNGSPLYRKATEGDAMMYPLRRLMTAFNSCVPYDGPSKWWHGKVPLVKFTCDDWPWEPFGFPLTKDGASMQRSIVNLMRMIEEAARVRLDPPVQYDEGQFSKEYIDRLDLRSTGVRIPTSMALGEIGIKPVLDPRFYDVPGWIPDFIKQQEERMDYMSALRDMAALAKAKQIPSAESIEKLFEMAGPIVQDIAQADERSLAELAEMWKSMAFQFYHARRRIRLLGDDGVTREDFDYEPGNLVPAHMPGEERGGPSRYTNIDRARMHQNSFFYQVVQGEVHQITHTARKMLLATLFFRGFPIDPWTMAEAFDLQGFGAHPEGTVTIMDRWVAWKKLQVDLSKELQGGAEAGGEGPPPGRVPTFQKQPALKSKEGGARTTIATS